MAFRARPHRFALGRAPTSRARCRVCGRLIAAGDARFTVYASVRPGRVTVFHRHVACTSNRLLAAAMSTAGCVDSVVVEGAVTDGERRILCNELAATLLSRSSTSPALTMRACVPVARGASAPICSPWQLARHAPQAMADDGACRSE